MLNWVGGNERDTDRQRGRGRERERGGWETIYSWGCREVRSVTWWTSNHAGRGRGDHNPPPLAVICPPYCISIFSIRLQRCCSERWLCTKFSIYCIPVVSSWPACEDIIIIIGIKGLGLPQNLVVTGGLTR